MGFSFYILGSSYGISGSQLGGIGITVPSDVTEVTPNINGMTYSGAAYSELPFAG